MDSGFTQQQFDVLAKHARGRSPGGTQHPTYRVLRAAHDATKEWADALRKELFPEGRVRCRRAPADYGYVLPYTWAKIYPYDGAPEELAFTVGIDAGGTFVVKIDTVGKDKSLRADYEAIRGPANDGSSIAEVIEASRGLELSREDLVAWSANAIARFSPDYESLMAMLGLEPRLSLVTDTKLAWDWSDEWRRAMLDGAISRGSTVWIPEAEIVADKPKREANGGFSLALGVDPTSKARAVSFVDSSRPGSRHPLSNFAVDPHGRRFLLHQARLNAAGSNIVEDQFLKASGLRPTRIDVSEEDAARRWLRVADLDAPASEIRRSTGRFVRYCALVRHVVAAGEIVPAAVPLEAERPWYVRIAPDEVGGTYVVRARDAQQERVVERRHGLVSLRLQEALGGRVVFRKLQHPLGFEIDGEVLREGAKPLLIEIKTAIDASSIHAGIGQLHLYSRLLPGLSNHGLVLLLPKLPASEIVAAIRNAKIEVHTYTWGRSSDDAEVVFSADFLDLCLGASDSRA